jgi:hypothetical protein
LNGSFTAASPFFLKVKDRQTGGIRIVEDERMNVYDRVRTLLIFSGEKVRSFAN